MYTQAVSNTAVNPDFKGFAFSHSPGQRPSSCLMMIGSPQRKAPGEITDVSRAMAGKQMVRRCASMIAAMAVFSLNGAYGQVSANPSLQGNNVDQASLIQANLNMAQKPGAGKDPDLRQPPPGGNPLWVIPMSALSGTPERPIFSASRRPPAPPADPLPVAEAPPPPPPPPPAPEHPPFALVGTVIGMPQNVALVVSQKTQNFVRLHVGESASGWYLRAVDSRTITLEKNSQVVTLSLRGVAAPTSQEARSFASLADSNF